MPTKSRNEREMKGLDGSNPPPLASQSDVCPPLRRAAENWRAYAAFCALKGTGDVDNCASSAR
jgi:hypothetical protein